MRDVILRPDAEGDIEDIADYTLEQWDLEQARFYVHNLRQAIEGLSSGALRYPLCETVYPGLRRRRSAMHHIYYLTFDNRVEIVRILHVQRDPGPYLPLEG
jgi:toxin ParE1/3/4